jgi:hypothetical protein
MLTIADEGMKGCAAAHGSGNGLRRRLAMPAIPLLLEQDGSPFVRNQRYAPSARDASPNAEAYCLVNTCLISYKRIEAAMQQVVHSTKR